MSIYFNVPEDKNVFLSKILAHLVKPHCKLGTHLRRKAFLTIRSAKRLRLLDYGIRFLICQKYHLLCRCNRVSTCSLTRLVVPGAFHLEEAVTEISQAPQLFSALHCNLGLLEIWSQSN